MDKFKSLSYDGFGINGRDEYRTRLATFTGSLPEEQRKQFGPLFAAAPELLALLKRINTAFYVDGTAKALKPVMAETRDAIRRAEGRA